MAIEVSTSFKALILCLLVAQNIGLVIVTRYSKAVLHEEYINSSVVLMMEVTKLLFATMAVSMKWEESHLHSKPWGLFKKITYLWRTSLVMGVPAGCYFIQNVLAYTALQNLSSSVYGVLQQAKILMAAIFSVILLGKKINSTRWRALILLFLGATLVEYHTFQEHDDSETEQNGDPLAGTIAMLIMILMSGFAGVYYEGVLKNIKTDGETFSVWDRNVQLASWSIVLALGTAFVRDGDLIAEQGLFSGWSFVTVFQCFLMTSGGLLVAVIIKYTSVIIKGMAMAIALVGISLVGWMFLDDNLDMIFLVGMSVVIIAVFNYNDPRALDPKEPKYKPVATDPSGADPDVELGTSKS